MNKPVLKIEINRASAKAAAMVLLLWFNSSAVFPEEQNKIQALPNEVSIRELLRIVREKSPRYAVAQAVKLRRRKRKLWRQTCCLIPKSVMAVMIKPEGAEIPSSMGQDAYRLGKTGLLELLDSSRSSTEIKLNHLELLVAEIEAELDTLMASGLLAASFEDLQ